MKKFISLYSFVFLLISVNTEARITKIVVDKTESYASGKTFGTIGQYEKLIGRAYGEVNPNDKHNAIIQDIQLALWVLIKMKITSLFLKE